jgi:uncharacterized damage-inducible protein DinB
MRAEAIMDFRGPRSSSSLPAAILAAWETNNRVNVYLLEQIAAPLWAAHIPGIPHRTIRMIAAHLHNARCRWIKTLGAEHGIAPPVRVDQRTVSRRALIAALARSYRGLRAILQLGLDADGVVPPSKAYVWRNLPLDVGHVLTYFVAHEAHHRGQIIMAARQLGQRLPSEAVGGVWQWTRLSRARR